MIPIAPVPDEQLEAPGVPGLPPSDRKTPHQACPQGSHCAVPSFIDWPNAEPLVGVPLPLPHVPYVQEL